MKTSSKTTTKTNEKEVKKEFNLKEAFVLWINMSKKGEKYLSGNHFNEKTEETTEFVGYYNTNKKNPNQPDIRIYSVIDGKQDIEVACLWDNVSENGKKYLTGKTNDDEKLIGFYTKERINQRPDIRVYYKED